MARQGDRAALLADAPSALPRGGRHEPPGRGSVPQPRSPLDQEAISVSRVPDRARPPGLRTDDVLEGHLRVRRRRRRARPRSSCMAAPRQPRSEARHGVRRWSHRSARSRRQPAALGQQSVHRRDSQVARRGVHPGVARALPHERRRRGTRRRDVAGARHRWSFPGASRQRRAIGPRNRRRGRDGSRSGRGARPSREDTTMTTPIADLRARCGEEASHEDAARGMFERIAPTYDTLNRLMSAGIDRRWRARAVAEVGKATGALAGPVLDLCAGTMDLTAMIAEALPRVEVVALDFSPKMLDAGRHKAPEAKVVVGDALALPFEDGAFAAVVCGFGVRNFADPVRGAREALRVLRPGGIFVTLELFRPSRWTTRAFHLAYAQVVLPAVGGLVSGD